MNIRSVVSVAAVLALVVAGSCNCPGGAPCSNDLDCQTPARCVQGICQGPGTGTGTGTGGTGTGGSTAAGGGTGTGGFGGSGGIFDVDSGCAAVSSQAMLGTRPVDIIMVIDNSGSMTAEIIGVQDNVNANFASILNDGGLDYRVILLSRHGSPTVGQSVCIAPPLSGNATCTPPPAAPTNGPRFFHYDIEVSSTNALQLILQRYTQPDMRGQPAGGYSTWLRQGAQKTILVITDDNSSIAPAAFETGLFALNPPHFGTAAARNYKLHSIIGLPQKPNPNDPYLPTDPIATGTCDSGVNNGANYQPLSVTTGGLRFPVCHPDYYNTVFRTIAQGVVASAMVQCEFVIPPAPPGFTMFNRIIVNYLPMGTGAPQAFTKVASQALCGPMNYYVDTNRIVLCPAACTAVRADPMAKVDVIFTCEPEIN